MECACVRQTDLPNTSKLFTDLIYHFDRVSDFYPDAPNDRNALVRAATFDFPEDRRAALVAALRPLNPGNPSLDILAQPGAVAIVTGQQVGLFSGPAYTVYKALTAIRIARELADLGIAAVPVFWLATEDHDFAEIDHTWVFGSDHQPVRVGISGPSGNGTQPVGGIALRDVPIAALGEALSGLPFAQETIALVQRAYAPGETMGTAFATMLRELFANYGVLMIDPMLPSIRQIAAPLMRTAVERTPELIDALSVRSKQLVERGYHAQVLVDNRTSLAFLLDAGKRIALRRSNGDFVGHHYKLSVQELADRAVDLSPNALLRPVVQDFLLPTAAYVGGPAELAYLAQSQVLYQGLLGRQPVAFPRAGFTLLDERSHKRMARYRLNPTDLFTNEEALRDKIASRLVPVELRRHIDETRTATHDILERLRTELHRFDITLAGALETSRRKIEYQMEKIAKKTARQMMARDEQALRDERSLHGLVFPERHLQERLYSIVPFLAKYGPGLVDQIYQAVRLECPDHQFVTL